MPQFWYGGDATGEWYNKGHQCYAGEHVDLSDLQTALGLAAKLDEWEDRQDDTRWVIRLAFAIVGSPQWVEAVREMIARIEHIGRDHAIRRTLGWTVQAGTLATWEQSKEGRAWYMGLPEGVRQFHVDRYTDLTGVTDPAEALRAIYESVCS